MRSGSHARHVPSTDSRDSFAAHTPDRHRAVPMQEARVGHRTERGEALLEHDDLIQRQPRWRASLMQHFERCSWDCCASFIYVEATAHPLPKWAIVLPDFFAKSLPFFGPIGTSAKQKPRHRCRGFAFLSVRRRRGGWIRNPCRPCRRRGACRHRRRRSSSSAVRRPWLRW